MREISSVLASWAVKQAPHDPTGPRRDRRHGPGPDRRQVLKAQGIRMAVQVEAVLRYVAGDATVAAIPPQTLARMLQNAETICVIKRSAEFVNWCPAAEALAAMIVPVALWVGRESLGFCEEMASRLAPRLKVLVITVPGEHAAYFDHRPELAESLRPILRRWSARCRLCGSSKAGYR
jgi:hypothetical protein